MTFIFWLSFCVLFYAFLGYPFIVNFAARFWGMKTLEHNAYAPKVSILLSVYNEEKIIMQKIENFLHLNYPEDLIELIVILDGCTDKTEEIVRLYNNKRIRLILQNQRSGKTSALNKAVGNAQGDILVFTDANSMLHKDSIRKLTGHFADDRVGLVSGKSVYIDGDGNETLGSIYRHYEEWIKAGESRLYSIVGADGALYALRKDLYLQIDSEYINDLLHPIQVVQAGFVAISDSSAIVFEEQEDDNNSELRRQIRIMSQAWLLCLSSLGGLLKNQRFGFLWQLISHKIIRWFSLPFVICLLLSSIFIIKVDILSILLFFVFVGAVYKINTRASRSIINFIYMFSIVHYAAIVGLVYALRGIKFVTWNPRDI